MTVYTFDHEPEADDLVSAGVDAGDTFATPTARFDVVMICDHGSYYVERVREV